MRLLLDTHVAVWSVTWSARLPAALVDLLLQNAGDTFVSVASLWEIAIKHARPRRDPMPFGAEKALAHFVEAGHQTIDVRAPHAIAMSAVGLPHADPFDRLLVAQAMAEGMTLVTMDRALAAHHHPDVRLF